MQLRRGRLRRLHFAQNDFRVRAVDPAGNVDASPASRSWTAAVASAPPPAAPPLPPGCTIGGTSRGETIYGTSSRDVICGLGGNDTVKGGSGNDRISSGTHNPNTPDGVGSNAFADSGPGQDTSSTNTGDKRRPCP